MKKANLILFLFFTSVTFAQQDSIVQAMILDSADISAEKEYNKGIDFFKKNEYSSALECFSAAIQFKPGFDKAIYNRGLTYFEMLKYVEAVKDMESVIEIIPSGDAYYWKAKSQDRKSVV